MQNAQMPAAGVPNIQRRRATNVSARASLVDEAKRLHINMSEIFENALDHAVREHKRAQWLEDNREAIEAYNRRVAKHGVFSDGLRRF